MRKRPGTGASWGWAEGIRELQHGAQSGPLHGILVLLERLEDGCRMPSPGEGQQSGKPA